MKSLKKFSLSLVMLLGLILRLIMVQSRGIWYDDAFSFFLAKQPLDQIIRGTAADTMPPLYYFLLHYWLKLGSSVWVLRSLNIFISLGIIFFVYRWISDLAGHSAGLWAGLIVAVSPLEIYHAQEIRMYALLAFLLLGYAWFFTRIYLRSTSSADPRWYDWVGFVGFGVCAMYSHNLAIFTLIVPVIMTLILRRWRLTIWLSGALLLVGLFTIPWLIVIPGQMEKIQRAFWTPRPGFVEVIQTLIVFVTNLPLPSFLLITAAIGSLQIMVLFIFETIKNKWRDDISWILISFAVIPGVLLFLASYLMRPVFVPRAIMMSSIAYSGLIARVAACGRNRVVGVLIGGLMVALAIVSLPTQYLYRSFPRSPFQEVAATLSIEPSNLGVIVNDNKLSYFPIHYYAPSLPQKFLADEPRGHNDTYAPQTQQAMGIFPDPDIQTAVGNATKVVFITFASTAKEYISQGLPEHPVLSWLDNNFSLAWKQTFSDLDVFEYTR